MASHAAGMTPYIDPSLLCCQGTHHNAQFPLDTISSLAYIHTYFIHHMRVCHIQDLDMG